MKTKSLKGLLQKIFLFLGFFLLFFTVSIISVKASTLSRPDTITGGKLVRLDGYWAYQYKDGTYARKSFLKIDGKTCYFNAKGYRWFGWHTYEGKKYYFGTKNQGYLFTDQMIYYKGDYYYLNKDGTVKTGWFTSGSGDRYYFARDGKAYTGKKKIDSMIRYFSKTGILLHSGANLNPQSDCAILVNADTGEVLFAKNEFLAHANASTTKIMTCILALEKSNLKDKVKVSANAASQEPTKLYMKEGQIFRMKDLLYSLMLPSHNDTAVAIGEHISGSTKRFVNLMNRKAKALGCTNTHFATPNGLDAGCNHYTTVSDLAKIARYALTVPGFRDIIKTRTYSFRSLNDNKQYTVTTTNALLGNMPGVIGMKTGFTNKAGYCFAGLIKTPSGNTYLSITLGAPTSAVRWNDARLLLRYAYGL